jgi:hypothetical protein
MPRIGRARAAGGSRVRVLWARGERSGVTEVVDLSPLIDQYKLYAPLRGDPEAFDTVRITDDGEALEWLDGAIDVPATSIERLAREQMTGEEFRDFLERNRLTRRAAAAELGRSLRAIQLYLRSREPIPRVVALACRGFEAGRQAGAPRTGGFDVHLPADWEGAVGFGEAERPAVASRGRTKG